MFRNPQLTTCVLFCLRERERGGGEGGGGGGRQKSREAEVPLGTCKTRPRKKRGGALRALPDCPPATSHSVQDAAKKIHRAHALAPQHGTPAQESQRRTPALPRGRSVAATAEATPSVFPPTPPTQSVSNPKQFCLPGRFPSSFRSLRICGPFCPCFPPPQVSQTTCPPTKSVSNPKRVCQPGSLAFHPPPHTT